MVAALPRDRSMATAFQRQVDAKLNPSAAQAASGEAADPMPGDSPASAGSAPAAPQSVKLKGQITELLCGRVPEVLFTVSSGSQSTLLHVKDISKVEIREAGVASSASTVLCAKWKDRKVAVAYEGMKEGTAQGEVKSIDLQ